jgi:hypothetical protein
MYVLAEKFGYLKIPNMNGNPKIKMQVCTTIVLPVVLHGYETSSLTLRDGN